VLLAMADFHNPDGWCPGPFLALDPPESGFGHFPGSALPVSRVPSQILDTDRAGMTPDCSM
jgi:hypothetical protein